MAEVIKYGCIRDGAFFRTLAQCGGRAGVMEQIEQVLYTCCDIKRRVVLADERDTGERLVLNFGHTAGHAFELAGNYETWTHGQAVAVGMLWAVRMGERLGITPAGIREELCAVLEQYGLPTHIPCPWATMERAVGLDKKRARGGISFVLLSRLGWAEPKQMETGLLLDQLRQLHEEQA
jgi:3-dehydroquinate synthase